jgi:hypothetical protein
MINTRPRTMDATFRSTNSSRTASANIVRSVASAPASATNLDAGKHAGAHEVIDPGTAHPERLSNLVRTQQQSLHDLLPGWVAGVIGGLICSRCHLPPSCD